jgi:ribosomal protein L37AE/L43A
MDYPKNGCLKFVDWSKNVSQIDLEIAILLNQLLGVNIIVPNNVVTQKENNMKKIRDEVYTKIRKNCPTCDKHTIHIIESTISTCRECNTSTDSDADELFGPIDEVVE